MTAHECTYNFKINCKSTAGCSEDNTHGSLQCSPVIGGQVRGELGSLWLTELICGLLFAFVVFECFCVWMMSNLPFLFGDLMVSLVCLRQWLAVVFALI